MLLHRILYTDSSCGLITRKGSCVEESYLENARVELSVPSSCFE